MAKCGFVFLIIALLALSVFDRQQNHSTASQSSFAESLCTRKAGSRRQGLFPVMDYRSPRRQLPGVQDYLQAERAHFQ
jgi:hypothetical protein